MHTSRAYATVLCISFKHHKLDQVLFTIQTQKACVRAGLLMKDFPLRLAKRRKQANAEKKQKTNSADDQCASSGEKSQTIVLIQECGKLQS